MYKDSVKLMKKNNVIFEKGLIGNEVLQIEKTYNITFPVSLRNFLMTELPVSKGFCNWRNMNKTNIQDIKNKINYPIQYIYNMPYEVYWCDNWGKEPENKINFKNEVIKRLEKAPKLIPVFSHRYIPIIDNLDPPIISVHGTDIIYVGKDLRDYFMVEYEIKKQNDISFNDIKPIPFWTDLI